jgi:ABC-type dipeptide/oligopeptide/nickel transport system permease subunit
MSIEVTAAADSRGARRQARAEVWDRFKHSAPGMTGVVLWLIFGLMAIAYPILTRTVWDPEVYDPETGIDMVIVEKEYVLEVTDPDTQVGRVEAFLSNMYAQPGDVIEVRAPAGIGLAHPLSTDASGRDVLAMLLAGAGTAFVMALAAALTTAIVAISLAAVAAYNGGWIDTVLSNVSGALLLLPAPLLMIILGTSPVGEHIGPAQFGFLYGLLAGAGAAAIVVRSQAVQTMQRAFIDSARTSGAGGSRIVIRHLVPHLIPLAAISMLVGVTGAIVADAFVSFLAYGETRFSWGTMINWAIRGRPNMRVLVHTEWHVLFFGGLAVTLLAAAYYLIAIGLHTAFDTPRFKR